MNQTDVQAAAAPLTDDERKLSGAIALLTQHEFLAPLLAAAIADGYKFNINPDLKTSAAHEGRSERYPTPEIDFRAGRTIAQYAESLCHELIHFAITRAGRIWGDLLNPVADMAMRLCEEAAVFAITSDLMYQAAHGINMKGGAAYPELWQANLDSSFYTARAYEETAGNPVRAVRESFKRFYTMPIPGYTQDYQDRSLENILKFNSSILLNHKNFTATFKPSDFLKFLPAPYGDILRPCITQMNPLDQDHLVLRFSTAQKMETKFLAPRLAAFGTKPANLKVFVEDNNGEVFPWRLAGESLARQRPMPRIAETNSHRPALAHAF